MWGGCILLISVRVRHDPIGFAGATPVGVMCVGSLLDPRRRRLGGVVSRAARYVRQAAVARKKGGEARTLRDCQCLPSSRATRA